jgi:hypothetical protein
MSAAPVATAATDMSVQNLQRLVDAASDVLRLAVAISPATVSPPRSSGPLDAATPTANRASSYGAIPATAEPTAASPPPVPAFVPALGTAELLAQRTEQLYARVARHRSARLASAQGRVFNEPDASHEPSSDNFGADASQPPLRRSQLGMSASLSRLSASKAPPVRPSTSHFTPRSTRIRLRSSQSSAVLRRSHETPGDSSACIRPRSAPRARTPPGSGHHDAAAPQSTTLAPIRHRFTSPGPASALLAGSGAPPTATFGRSVVPARLAEDAALARASPVIPRRKSLTNEVTQASQARHIMRLRAAREAAAAKEAALRQLPGQRQPASATRVRSGRQSEVL